jgi:hypothetical protein
LAWLRLYLYNTKVVSKMKYQDAVPQSTQCPDFLRDIPPTERRSRPSERYGMCYKNNRRKGTVFWCPQCEAGLCVRAATRLTDNVPLSR